MFTKQGIAGVCAVYVQMIVVGNEEGSRSNLNKFIMNSKCPYL